jgi:hypothetical protein
MYLPSTFHNLVVLFALAFKEDYAFFLLLSDRREKPLVLTVHLTETHVALHSTSETPTAFLHFPSNTNLAGGEPIAPSIGNLR